MSNISITPQLQRDGNSQPDRDIRYRNPEEVKVDARSVLDILHFFWQYAKVVRYYDIQAGEQGDWSSFFTQSAPFQIANIAQFDAETWWSGFQKHCEQARNKAHLGATNHLVTYLFDAFAVWKNWGEGLADDKTLVAQTVLKLNETNVKSLAENFILIQNVVTQKFGLKINRDAKTLLGAPWNLDETLLTRSDESLQQKRGNLQTLLPDLLSFDGTNSGKLERIGELLYRSFLALDTCFTTKNDDTDFIVNDYKHAPHLGLLFAFLSLYKEAQGELNQLTNRHLEYFYKEVLLFKNKAAIPDKAHLVFELAKQMQAGQLLREGTLYKDGKDNNKAEVIFGLDSEIVVNKAKVAAVYTFNYPNNGFLYSNKLDFSDPVKSWKTFGRAFGESQKEAIGNIKYPFCELAITREKEEQRNNLAFVLAARVLEIRDKAESVVVNFTCNGAWNPEFEKHLKVYCSGKKGWEEALSFSVETVSVSPSPLITTIKFKITNSAAILPMNEAIAKKEGFKGAFATHPALKFELDTNGTISENLVCQFRALQITDISIDVEAALNKSLIAFNDEGNIDVTKPFMPFGGQANLSFYFGAEEWVGKKIVKIDAELVWENETPTTLNEPPFFNATFSNKNKVFATIKAENYTKSDIIIFESKKIKIEMESFKVTDFNRQQYKGLVSLNLNSLYFQFGKYLEVFKKQASAQVEFAKNPKIKIDDAYYNEGAIIKLGSAVGNINAANVSVAFPNTTPFIPAFKNFTLTYTATAAKEDIKLIHLHPVEKTYDIVETLSNTSFFAEFKPQKGALLIGLEAAQEGTNVALLFQFLPYSGNPDVDWGEITWSILRKENKWEKLEKGVDYQDDTEEFKQSGIVNFKISKSKIPLLLETEAQKVLNQITVMPDNLLWLKASVESQPEAFDKLLSIQAQAAKATFQPSLQNDLERLAKPLEAEKIKKPLIENAGIAKIKQPFPSFDGQTTEKNPAFYRRVSEQLRHKGRAVTVWDYEMLTLENFPIVYKSKAIPHYFVKIEEDEAQLKREICYSNCHFQTGDRANHVTLVVVPDVSLLPDEKEVRERPKVNRNTLEDIGDFLKGNAEKKQAARTSHFAEVQAINPDYIGVLIDFKVQFKAGKDENFYEALLKEEIRTFLAPWKTGRSDLIHFGGSLHFSTVLFFVEQRDYVDYVHDFKMFDDKGIRQTIIKTQKPYEVITNNLCKHRIEVVSC